MSRIWQAEECLKSAGFELEGILKDAFYKNGKLYNEYVYGLVKGE